jgi:hypothetical protein
MNWFLGYVCFALAFYLLCVVTAKGPDGEKRVRCKD